MFRVRGSALNKRTPRYFAVDLPSLSCLLLLSTAMATETREGAPPEDKGDGRERKQPNVPPVPQTLVSESDPIHVICTATGRRLIISRQDDLKQLFRVLGPRYGDPPFKGEILMPLREDGEPGPFYCWVRTSTHTVTPTDAKNLWTAAAVVAVLAGIVLYAGTKLAGG